jgi:TatD DNase family protein
MGIFMRIPVIDSHVHLDQFTNPAETVQEAREAGLEGMVAVGMDLKSNQKTLALSRQYKGYVFPALGYHPWSVTISGVRDTLDHIRDHLDEAVALGEIGLDYKVSVAKELQLLVFKDLLEMAWLKKKPLICHCRLSHGEALELIRKQDLERVVFHWYSGPMDTLKALLLAGYYISATPALVYSPRHREALAAAPLKQILIETDSPTAFRGEPSSPAQVHRTLTELAGLKGVEIEEAAEKTTRNTREFFGLG